MTFFDISKKMLKADFDKYRLYFFCNLFAVSLFYCFTAISSNESFMDGQIVDPIISSNIYAPSLLTTLFLIFFLPASCQVFLASRKQDYGIMISLGMSQKEAFRNMLLENLVTAGLALLAALMTGTILSFLFFTVITHGIGIDGVQWQFRLEPYKITVLLFAVIIGIAFVIAALRLLQEKIGTLLKAQYHAEKKGIIERILYRLMPVYMKKHLLEWSFVRRHKKAWGLRYILASLLIASGVFFAGFCIILYPGFLHNAETYAPYDMVYSEIYGLNQVPIENVLKILEENNVTVNQYLQMTYARDSVFTYLPVTEVNRVFGCDYQVEEGQFLNIFQYDLQDGYEHDLQPVSVITLDHEKLYSEGSDIRILFNQNGDAFADRTVIVNDADFEKIKKDTDCYFGLANLFSFEQWDSSYEGVCAVKEYLAENNMLGYLNDDTLLDETDRYSEQLSSKVESYQNGKKSGQLIIFFMAFVIGLMLIAAFLLIYFRIQAEKEEDNRAIHSLYLIGMTEKESEKCLRFKKRMRFIPPLIAGIMISLFPMYYLF